MSDAVRRLVDRASINAAGWYRVDCPFCEDADGHADHKQSLSVCGVEPPPAGGAPLGFYRCWRCGSKGVVPDLDEPAQGHWSGPSTAAVEITMPCGYIPIGEEPGLSARCTEPYRDYLRGRGILESMWVGIGASAVLNGYFAGRILLPIWDGGRLRGFAARAIHTDVDRKYLYPHGMRRVDLLFNREALAVETDRPAILVEGILDALPYWPDAVACLGKPTRAQLELVAAARRPVAVALDGDAWREAEAVAMGLRLDGLRAGSVRLPPKADPNTVPAGWLRRCADECLNE